MTSHESDRIAGDSTGTSTHALVDRLNAGEPYAVAFSGQGNSS